MTALVFAEVRHGQLHPGVASAITAAQVWGEVDVVMLTAEAVPVPYVGVRRVRQVIDPTLHCPTPDALTPTLGAMADEYSHFVAPHSPLGRSVMARLAARLRVPMVSDVVAIDGTTLTRPCYAGALHEVLYMNTARMVMTVRPSSFPSAAVCTPATVEEAPFVCGTIECHVMNLVATPSARPPLATAKVVVAGGRGLGDKENFVLVEGLADVLSAAVGASRAAVDAGFVPNDLQIGQTGKIVAPQIYIALGISGAVQHLAGIKGAKKIVVINKDPTAPIFKVADYGLVADIFEVVPQLIEKLKT